MTDTDKNPNQNKVDMLEQPTRHYVLIMDDNSRWEGDAVFFIDAVQKAERETGKNAKYCVSP
jgi:hypothetical protein